MECERCKINTPNCEELLSFILIDGISFNVRRCTWCSLCISFEVSEEWRSIEHILKRDSHISGLQRASSIEDKVVHYILRQFIYNENERLEECVQQTIFDTPDEEDLIMLLWLNGTAIGFYTLKLRGTWIAETNEVYSMTTLDTIFIRKSHRRSGYCQEMLNHICTSHNGDIGISKPISSEMKAALQKFLIDHPHLRSRLWEIEGTGGEGFRKLAWLVLAKEMRCAEQSSHVGERGNPVQ